MKLSSIAIIPGLLGMANAVNMSKYSPQKGVDAGFQAYLKELYASAEDTAATTAFTNFFTSTGQLIVLTNTATGAEEILALKQKLLPPGGPKHWNHFPNVTSVDSETTAQKIYKVLGVIETTYDGGNCSSAYYSSRFTVTKNTAGAVQLTTHAGTLAKYDDFVVDPDTSPTPIECTS
ncbi:hypothetical protein DOTSEDRAFT_71410 [Dothistroma septosporum NZE10]|uniref:SnoaL-like domain-containing protein n=1 Tax=Dothistroma septosporum (strain NZE10 / CBS 128990) TaxID=675120 RepID=N1PTG1_DOTSN|nr:hypothetical protein DOTSEDRAFT_71410 [Dothistroma septosporum NZE10]